MGLTEDERKRLELLRAADPEFRKAHDEYLRDWQEELAQLGKIVSAGQVGHWAGADSQKPKGRRRAQGGVAESVAAQAVQATPLPRV